MTDTEWYQDALISPEVREVRLRVGLIPSTDHVQVMAEMLDPMTGVLLAQWSCPHGTMHSLPRMLDRARSKIDEWLGDAAEPF